MKPTDFESALSQDLLKCFVHYDPETGVLFRKGYERTTANPGRSRYKMVRIKGKKYLVHRLAWLYVYGVFPKQLLDHINGDTHDNRISNLRETDQRGNNQNTLRHRQGKLVGAHYNKKNRKYAARANIGKKVIHLGYFNTEEEASNVYLVVVEQFKISGTVTVNTKKYDKRGTTFHKCSGKWAAAFRGNHIGLYDTEQEAHEAYLEYKRSKEIKV